MNWLKSITFNQALLGIGALMTLAVAYDLARHRLAKHPIDPKWIVHGGDPRRGRAAIHEYGCGACHVIPGVRGANGRVGPRLDGIREQIYVGGVLPNGPDTMADWLRRPREINPLTAMPNLGVTEQDARDITAYLFTLR